MIGPLAFIHHLLLYLFLKTESSMSRLYEHIQPVNKDVHSDHFLIFIMPSLTTLNTIPQVLALSTLGATQHDSLGHLNDPISPKACLARFARHPDKQATNGRSSDLPTTSVTATRLWNATCSCSYLASLDVIINLVSTLTCVFDLSAKPPLGNS